VNQDSSSPAPLHLHHFGISVTDLDRSLEFYCGVLGAAVVLPPNAADNFDGRRAVLMLSNGMGLDVNEFATNAGDAFDASRSGLDHLAFAANSSEGLAAWAARLDEYGVVHSPIRTIAGIGVRIFDFRDPDGIQLEFVHMDTGGSWAKRKHDLAGAGS
jgi:glyoxylase I family protein